MIYITLYCSVNARYRDPAENASPLTNKSDIFLNYLREGAMLLTNPVFYQDIYFRRWKMKRFSLLMCVVAVLFSATMSFAQRERDEGCRGKACSTEARGENEERELDLQERRLEMQFDQAKREIELEKLKRGAHSGRRHPMVGPRRSGHHGMKTGMRRPGGCPMMKGKSGCKKMAGPILLLMFIVSILLSVWVYKDIRKRDSDSGIWIVIVFLTGLFGAAVYAIVRIGDDKK